jgi:hypothetical protein
MRLLTGPIEINRERNHSAKPYRKEALQEIGLSVQAALGRMSLPTRSRKKRSKLLRYECAG